MITVYKVVSVDGNQRKSFNIFSREDLNEMLEQIGKLLTYKIGTPTYPKSGMPALFAFKNLDSARVFMKGVIENRKFEIWKCQAEISSDQGQISPVFTWPDDTVFCDSITLLEKIQ